jgi:hypothetical protein
VRTLDLPAGGVLLCCCCCCVADCCVLTHCGLPMVAHLPALRRSGDRRHRRVLRAERAHG